MLVFHVLLFDSDMDICTHFTMFLTRWEDFGLSPLLGPLLLPTLFIAKSSSENASEAVSFILPEKKYKKVHTQ